MKSGWALEAENAKLKNGYRQTRCSKDNTTLKAWKKW